MRAANKARAENGVKEQLPNWSPYMLRHACATRIKREHGLEAVRVLLGHSSAEMAQHYAENDLAQARAVMASAG